MQRTQFHVGSRASRRARSLAPLIVAATIGCCVSACGSGIAGTASGTASPSNDQPGDPGTVSGRDTPNGQGQGTTTAGLSTPGAVLSDWMHKVAAGDRGAACKDMGQPGLSPERSTAMCMSAAGAGTFDSLHSAFASYGIKPGTPISVDGAKVEGTTTTVSGSQIHVAGKALDSLMLAHSTGVQSGQISISFQLSRINRSWYVTGMDFNA